MKKPSTRPPKTKPQSLAARPLWLGRLPAKIFPRGPRALYCYIAAFPTGICFLFNYRLAARFSVSVRTIRRWRSWLTKHRLIHTWWLDQTHPRITCHHYKSFRDWITRLAIPQPKKGQPQLHLTPDQKDARRRKFLHQLLSKPGRTLLSP